MVTVCSSSPVDLSTTFSFSFWGLIVSAILLGVSVVQGYLYFANNNDGWFMKSFVIVVLALDVTATFVFANAVHYYLIKNYGNPDTLSIMVESVIGEFVLSIVIVALSQLFYASRIYLGAGAQTQSYGRIAAFVVAGLSLFTFGVGIACSVLLYSNGRLYINVEKPNYKVVIGMEDFSAALCDAFATLSMCYYLSSLETSFKRTKSILSWLFFFSVNRGFLVCSTQIVWVVTLLAWPERQYWVPFHLLVSKLHVNTLLAMLNSRPVLRSRLEGRVDHIDRSGSISLGHFLSAMRPQIASDSSKDVDVLRDAEKVEIRKSQSLANPDEVHGPEAMELVVNQRLSIA